MATFDFIPHRPVRSIPHHPAFSRMYDLRAFDYFTGKVIQPAQA